MKFKLNDCGSLVTAEVGSHPRSFKPVPPNPGYWPVVPDRTVHLNMRAAGFWPERWGNFPFERINSGTPKPPAGPRSYKGNWKALGDDGRKTAFHSHSAGEQRSGQMRVSPAGNTMPTLGN